MRRELAVALGALILAVAGRAVADDPPGEVRAYVLGQLDARAEVLARTRAVVDAKVDETSALRGRRARAAYKLLRAGAATSVDAPERMATARRRAAARWLLARDRHEEALLAEEAGALAAAEARLTADRTAARAAPLPPAGLDWPAQGTIARRFGAYRHDRSKATLTRRGVDLDVAAGAEVRPIADGVVVYAGAIRGLDHGVVIDHGGWLSVTAKLDVPEVAAGAQVVRGQVIARPARRRVYLEVRVAVGAGGVPIDPALVLR